MEDLPPEGSPLSDYSPTQVEIIYDLAEALAVMIEPDDLPALPEGIRSRLSQLRQDLSSLHLRLTEQ